MPASGLIWHLQPDVDALLCPANVVLPSALKQLATSVDFPEKYSPADEQADMAKIVNSRSAFIVLP